MRNRRLRALSLVLVLLAGSALAELPAVKLVTSPLVAPATAWAYYGTASTHTAGAAAWTSTPPEVQELARALGAGRYTTAAYATNVYEYVRNNIAIEFRFGLSKGARGAIIDQSGTAFDQANLMMKLLVAGNVTGATYQVGQISLTGAQFQAWTGITNAATACQFLADGGIPATVNGATSCTSVTGTLPSTGTPIVMGHIWIVLNSQIYDPAYKVQIAKTPVALNTAMGCGTTCATTITSYVPAPATIAGTSPAVQEISGANVTGLDSTLKTYSTTLENYIRTQNAANVATLNPNMQVEDLVGGLTIDITQPTANGSLLPSSTYPSSSQYTWSDIPDQFRSTLTINFAGFSQLTYADETAGRRLRVFGIPSSPTTTTATLQAALYADSILLNGNTVANQGYTQPVTLTVTHPYSSSAGYANEILTFNEPFLSNVCATQIGCYGAPSAYWITGVMTIIQAWGDSSENTLNHYSGLQQNDVTSTYAANLVSDPRQVWPDQPVGVCNYGTPSATPVRDPGCRELHQPVVAASWLAQATRAMKLAASVNNSSVQAHHSMGIVLSGTTIGPGISLNVQSMMSINSSNPTSTDRGAAFTSIAAVMARLEGSVIQQQGNVVYSGDALSAIEEANVSNEQFLNVTAANITSAVTLLDSNYSSEDVANITAYANATTGYGLILPRNGQAGVVCDPGGCSNGSLTFVFNGVAALAPTAGRIAFLTTVLGWDKGGAGTSDPTDFVNGAVAIQNYTDRRKKSVLVDPTIGGLTLTPTPDLVTGTGEFPYSLSYQRSYSAKQDAFGRNSTTWFARSNANPSGLPIGWTHSLAILGRITNDGLASMGRTSALDASQVVAALYVLRTLNTTTPTFQSNLASVFVGSWLGKQLVGNVVSVNRPPKTDAFVQLPDGTFNSAPGNPEVLTQTGVRSYFGDNQWQYNALTYKLTGKDGSVLALAYGATTAVGGGGGQSIFIPTSWTYPSGAQVTFTYTDPGVGFRQEDAKCLTNVSNNLGRSLTFNNLCSFGTGTPTLPSATTVTDDSSRQIQFSLAASGTVYATSNHSLADLIDVTGLTVTSTDGTSNNIYQYVAAPAVPTNRTYYRINEWFTPLSSVTPYGIIDYDSLYRVKDERDNSTPQNITNYYIAGVYGLENQKRADRVDPTPFSSLTTQYFDKFSHLLQTIDPLGRVTSYTNDTFQRMSTITFPELNSDKFTYDLRHNVLTDTLVAKPGSVLANMVTTTSFPESPTTIVCVNAASCNEPATIKGPRTDVVDLTTYSYYANGQLARVVGPAVTGGNSQTDYQYTGYPGTSGTINLLTGQVLKVNSSTNRVHQYIYNTSAPGTNHLVPQNLVVDPTPTLVPPVTVGGSWTSPAETGALNLTTTFAFDTVGNPAQINGPRTDVTDITNYIFDSLRRLTTVTKLLGGANYAVTRYCYDADGELLSTNLARVAGQADPNVATAATNGQCSTAFPTASWQSETRTYYATEYLNTVTDAQGNVTQTLYDGLNRPVVAIDPDLRQIATVYDAAGQVQCTWRGGSGWTASTSLGCTWTPSSYAGTGALRYASYTYSLNGKQTSVQDADNNTTATAYDGLDRLRWALFADPNLGTLCTILPAGTTNYDSTAPTCTGLQTYEQSGYDSGGNRNSFQSRKGDLTTFTFDADNRNVTKAPAAKPVVTYAYNLANDKTTISNPALGSFLAHSTAYTFDAAGRKQSETDVTNNRTISYAYTDGVNRTQTTWPDGYYVTYSYDDLNRMQYAYENGTVALANYAYDPLSRRQTLTLGGQATNTVGYTYELDSALSSLTHSLNTVSVALNYTHNHSRQITTINAGDSFYLPLPTAETPIAYVPNGLNEYASVGGQASTYDLNGNLQTWFPASGESTYTYDSENRLIAAATNGAATPTVTFDYDSLGRRASKTSGGSTTTYLVDGDEEIAEYSGTTLLRRYITGPTIDDRIAHAEGSLTSAPPKTYYHVNHQGSVMAMTDLSGNVSQRLAYDEYGLLSASASGTGEPFQYTGRRFDVDTGLYYLRARYYSPQLGRFLQTDPVGYKDDVNLYTYVGNDPLDKTDPSGRSCEGSGTQWDCKVDNTNTPKDMTDKQKAAYAKQIKAFEKQYTAAVKSLTAHPNKEVQVKVGDNSFKVTAGQVASRLIGAEVSANPGESGPGAANSPSSNKIELNDPMLGRGAEVPVNLSHFQEMGITHEGIHWTGWGPMPDGSRSAYGEQHTFGPWKMGGEPLATQHQGPYNAAADELLQP